MLKDVKDSIELITIVSFERKEAPFGKHSTIEKMQLNVDSSSSLTMMLMSCDFHWDAMKDDVQQ